MKVKELIALLESVDPEARVFHSFDGDMALTEPGEIITVTKERDTWFAAKEGDVIILEA